jgi:hypothetical protein
MPPLKWPTYGHLLKRETQLGQETEILQVFGRRKWCKRKDRSDVSASELFWLDLVGETPATPEDLRQFVKRAFVSHSEK